MSLAFLFNFTQLYHPFLLISIVDLCNYKNLFNNSLLLIKTNIIIYYFTFLRQGAAKKELYMLKRGEPSGRLWLEGSPRFYHNFTRCFPLIPAPAALPSLRRPYAGQSLRFLCIRRYGSRTSVQSHRKALPAYLPS